ncbi:hypothetical protein IJ135_00480 [Candidatus Saccharibacteria bacterium]|nr:hypothetical protein [Candidatus Saccharibacteria bacterium]
MEKLNNHNSPDNNPEQPKNNNEQKGGAPDNQPQTLEEAKYESTLYSRDATLAIRDDLISNRQENPDDAKLSEDIEKNWNLLKKLNNELADYFHDKAYVDAARDMRYSEALEEYDEAHPGRRTNHIMGASALEKMDKAIQKILSEMPPIDLREMKAESPEIHARVLSRMNKAFAGRLTEIRDSGSRYMDDEEFSHWEDGYTETYNKMRQILSKNTAGDKAKQAEDMVLMVAFASEDDLPNTIEAYAAHQYRERVRALERAIDENGDRELAEKEHDKVAVFAMLAFEHLSLKPKDKIETQRVIQKFGGEKEYEAHRTLVHNKVIMALNDLNRLAKKFVIKTFTPRNFWPSDPEHKNNYTGQENTIMRYDRDIVEAYYAIAFRDTIEKDYEARRG